MTSGPRRSADAERAYTRALDAVPSLVCERASIRLAAGDTAGARADDARRALGFDSDIDPDALK